MLAFLVDAYDEDEIGGEPRTVLRLHPRLAPIKVSVLPLLRKEGHPERATALYQDLRSEEHTSELQSRQYLVCRLLLEKKKIPCSAQLEQPPSSFRLPPRPLAGLDAHSTPLWPDTSHGSPTRPALLSVCLRPYACQPTP